MGAYYIDEYAYNTNFTEEIDQRIHAPEMWDEALGLDAHSSIIGGRVHGNPNIEAVQVGWQEPIGRMAEQDEVYRTAIASRDESLGFQKLFEEMPTVWRRSGGFHVIEVSDPMLVEQGEAYVHEQYTDYMSANICEQRDEWDKLCRSYLFANIFLNLENGVVPGAVVVEPLRQLCGLPFEWLGAPIE